MKATPPPFVSLTLRSKIYGSGIDNLRRAETGAALASPSGAIPHGGLEANDRAPPPQCQRDWHGPGACHPTGTDRAAAISGATPRARRPGVDARAEGGRVSGRGSGSGEDGA